MIMYYDFIKYFVNDLVAIFTNYIKMLFKSCTCPIGLGMVVY